MKTLLDTQKDFINYFLSKYNLNNDFLLYESIINKKKDIQFTKNDTNVFITINTNNISICYRYKHFYKRYNLSDTSITIKTYNRKETYELHGILYTYKKFKFYWLGEILV